MKHIILSFACCLLLLITRAQQNEQVQTGNIMRSNGRIYVVIAVMLTILTGLIIYLARLDRKINKLEKETKNK